MNAPHAFSPTLALRPVPAALLDTLATRFAGRCATALAVRSRLFSGRRWRACSKR